MTIDREEGAVEYNSLGIPIKLPLIEYLKDRLDITNRKPLKNCIFVGIQHLTGVVVPLIHAIADAGIPYSRIFLIGKAYSTHPKVQAYLQSLGCYIGNKKLMHSAINPYETEIEAEIDDLLAMVMAQLDESVASSVLLFDEGGKAIRLIHEKYIEYAERFYCVEQTTRGIREVASLSLRCPIVDVALSPTKKEIEGPIIARSMVTSF